MDPKRPRRPSPRSIAISAGRWAAVFSLIASLAAAKEVGDFVLFGIDGVDLGGATRVYRGDIGSNGVVRGRQDAWIGEDVLADLVSLDRGVMVSGDVESNMLRLGQNVEIGGKQIAPLEIPVLEAFPLLEAAVPSEQDIRVEGGRKRRLRAGHYGRIEVGSGARLIFMGGEVHAERLVAESGAEVLFRRPTILHVASGVQFDENCVLAAISPAGPADVVVHLSGSGLIMLRSGCHVKANLVAPLGLVSIVHRVDFAGAVLANRVITGDEVVIDHHPAFNPAFELLKKCPRRKWNGRSEWRKFAQESSARGRWMSWRAWNARYRPDRCGGSAKASHPGGNKRWGR